jgi:hypothetical protein
MDGDSQPYRQIDRYGPGLSGDAVPSLNVGRPIPGRRRHAGRPPLTLAFQGSGNGERPPA